MLNKQDELGRKVTALEQSVTLVQENCLAIELLMLEIFHPPPQIDNPECAKNNQLLTTTFASVPTLACSRL